VDTLENSHGTHVAGIAAARVLGMWVPALGPDVLDQHIKLMVLKVAAETEEVDFLRVLSAMKYAMDHGASVISGSWTTFKDVDLLSAMMKAPTHTLFVMAAGNGKKVIENGIEVEKGVDVVKNNIYPAAYAAQLKNMIVVGALAPDGRRAYFSNYGVPGGAEILAPGVKIKSTIRGSGYGFLSGTSQATPFVSLTASIILAKCGRLPAALVRRRILDTAEYSQPPDGENPGSLNMLKATSVDRDLVELKGGGIVRAKLSRAVKFAQGTESCAKAKTAIVDQEGIERLVVGHDGNPSFLFLEDGTRRRGTLCADKLDIGGDAGRQPSVDEIRDIIWHVPTCNAH